MAITPNDQTRQFDYPPGRSLLKALANPTSTAVSADARADALADTGYSGAVSKGVTKRPAGTSNWIAGGAVSGYGTVAAGSNPGPKQNKQTDALRDQNDSASIAGPAAPQVTAGATGGTSPTATQVLNWTAVTGAVTYTVQKSIKSGATWGPWIAGVPPSVTAPTVTVTETGLSAGQVRFRVFTVGAPETSPSSNVVTVTIP